MSTHLTSKLDELAELVKAQTAEPKRFRPARFLELHKDLYEGYALVAGQPEQAKAIDHRIYHYLTTSNVVETTLGHIVLQLHATWFFVRAGARTQLADSYTHARSQRGKTENEGPYFRNVLVPRLLDGINTALPLAVRLELLASFAELENETFAPEIFGNDTTDAKLTEVPRAQFILGLVRRWVQEGRAKLAEQANTIENRLLRQGRLDKMAREDPLLRQILGPGGMGYIRRPPLWRRILGWFRRARNWLWALLVDLPGVVSRPVFYALIGIGWLAAATAFGLWVRADNRALGEGVERLAVLPPPSEPVEIEPAPAPLPAPVPPPDAQVDRTASMIARVLSGQKIEFAEASAVISPEGRGALGVIAGLLADAPDLDVRIEGHTDNLGDPQANLELSQARADAVRRFFVEQGIEAGRLGAQGFGSTVPLAPNETAEGRSTNRRIEIRVSRRTDG